MDALLREAGRKLAGERSFRRPSGTLRCRVMAASELLNEQLGAVTDVEPNGGYVIRSSGFPLVSSATPSSLGALLAHLFPSRFSHLPINPFWR